jgi:hypothetical protein
LVAPAPYITVVIARVARTTRADTSIRPHAMIIVVIIVFNDVIVGIV